MICNLFFLFGFAAWREKLGPVITCKYLTLRS
jgi:hypothetical protein